MRAQTHLLANEEYSHTFVLGRNYFIVRVNLRSFRVKLLRANWTSGETIQFLLNWRVVYRSICFSVGLRKPLDTVEYLFFVFKEYSCCNMAQSGRCSFLRQKNNALVIDFCTFGMAPRGAFFVLQNGFSSFYDFFFLLFLCFLHAVCSWFTSLFRETVGN